MSEQFDLTAPVLITGRGGSGTRLLSKLLQQSHLFLGNRLNRQGDSLEWVNINRRMMFNDIRLSNNKYNDKWIAQFRNLAAQITCNTTTKAYSNWGIKLPEMLFMLPEFFAAFPNTKLIHLIRHPIGLSCRRTHITSRLDNPVGKWVLPQAYEYLGLNFETSNASDIINNAISWKYQLDIITEFTEKHLSTHQYHVVKFEDMIITPQKVFEGINIFLGHSTNSQPEIKIDSKRAQKTKFVDTKDNNKIWSICEKTASKYGYTKQNWQLKINDS